MNAKTWNWPQFTLALLALIALIALIALTLVEQVTGKMADAGSKQILIGFATLAFAFFFQSSANSKAKDDVIATQAQAAAALGTPDIRITTAAMESGPSTPLAAVITPKALPAPPVATTPPPIPAKPAPPSTGDLS